MPDLDRPTNQYGLIKYPGEEGDLYKHPILDNEELPTPEVDRSPELVELYKKLHGRVKRLKEAWQGEITEVMTRRDIRHIDVDVEDKRRCGDLKPDETLVPIRVANDNIIKEQAPYINYITSSRNIAIFKPVDESLEQNVAPLEEDFTKKFRYPGWEIPQYKTIDGCETHGCDYVEIVVDKNKPGYFAVEHIARENLWYPTDIEDLQDAHTLVRNTRISEYRLRKFQNVIGEQVDKLFDNKDAYGDSCKDSTDSLADVQKVFYRKGDTVYVCWMSCDKGDYFIREPKPLYHGGKNFITDPLSGQVINAEDVFESSYPVVPLPYIISENGKLKDIKGRVFFDEYLQSGVTAVVSSIVNSWLRASEVYGAPKNNNTLSNEAASIAQTEHPIVGGKWLNQPAEFFNKPYPDSSGMNIVQGLLTLNKQEGAQVNYAAMNREDSRKTAREVSASMQMAAVLSSVQVTLFSIYMRNVLNKCWKIYSNYVKQGIIKVSPQLIEMFRYEYELSSAGDTEVIQREETLNRLMAIFPMIAQFPQALGVLMVLLEDILTLAFPKHGQKYVNALKMGSPQMIMEGMRQLLISIVQTNPEVIQRMSPQDQQGLQFILSQGQPATTEQSAQTQEQVSNATP